MQVLQGQLYTEFCSYGHKGDAKHHPLWQEKKEKQKIFGLTLHRTATKRNPPEKCSNALTRKESYTNKQGQNTRKMPEQRKTVALFPQSKSAENTGEH